MKFKETVNENIAYIALMTAINVVFVIMDMFLGGFSIFLLLVLPLASTFTFLFCKGKYFLIYLFATLVLAGILDLQLTLFYVLPSLVSGIIFGIFIKIKIPLIYTIASAVIMQVLFSFLSIPLIKLFYGVDMVKTIHQIIHISFDATSLVLPSLITLLAFIQTTITYVIIDNEIRKVNIQICKETNPYHFILGVFISSVLILTFSFIHLGVAFAFIPFTFFFAGQLFFYRFKNRNYWWLLALLFFDIFLFAFISGNIEKTQTLLYIFIFPLSFAIFEICCWQLQKNKKKITIKKERSDR